MIIDESKSATAGTNIDKKQFWAIKSLTGAGLEVLNAQRALTLDIFNLKGLTKADLVEDRLQYFKRLLKKDAKLQWSTAHKESQDEILDEFATANNRASIKAAKADKTSFFQYLRTTETLNMPLNANKVK